MTDHRMIVGEVRAAVRKAVVAAYRLGRRPAQPEVRIEAERTFDAAIRAAVRGLARAADEADRTGYHGRLRVLRDAVSRPEADPTNPDHLVWLAAVRYFAQELGMPFPPSSRDDGIVPDSSWAKGLTPSRDL